MGYLHCIESYDYRMTKKFHRDVAFDTINFFVQIVLINLSSMESLGILFHLPMMMQLLLLIFESFQYIEHDR